MCAGEGWEGWGEATRTALLQNAPHTTHTTGTVHERVPARTAMAVVEGSTTVFPHAGRLFLIDSPVSLSSGRPLFFAPVQQPSSAAVKRREPRSPPPRVKYRCVVERRRGERGR